MTLFSLRYSIVRPIATLFQLLESYLWLLNLIVLFLTIRLPFDAETILTASIYFLLVAYLSNIFYLKRNIKTYLLMFVYSFAYSLLLISIRVYSLITIFKTGWKTR